MNKLNSKNWYYEVLDEAFYNTGFNCPSKRIKINTNATASCFIFDKETKEEVAQISYDLRGNELYQLVDYYINEGYNKKDVLQWFNEKKDGLLITFSDKKDDEKLLEVGCLTKAYIDDNYGYIYAFNKDLELDEKDLDFFR